MCSRCEMIMILNTPWIPDVRFRETEWKELFVDRGLKSMEDDDGLMEVLIRMSEWVES